MSPRWVSVNDAAELLSVHPTTLRRMLRRGELPAIRVGKLWRIDIDAVTAPTTQNSGGGGVHSGVEVRTAPIAPGGLSRFARRGSPPPSARP